MLSTERLVRSARFLSRCSLSLVIERAKSTGMEVNRDFTSKDTMTSSLEIEYCFICCVKTELFWTVKVFFLTSDRTETRYLDTAHVGLLILLVMGHNGLPLICPEISCELSSKLSLKNHGNKERNACISLASLLHNTVYMA